MDLMGPVLQIVDKIFWTPISNCVTYHRSLEENIKILEEKLNELNCRKDDIESEINVGLGCGKIVKKEVELWLQKVNKINTDKHLEHEVGKGKYFSRARLGRLVAKKIQEVEELYKKGNFSNELMVDAVAVPVVVNAVPVVVNAVPVIVDAAPVVVDADPLIVDAVPVVVDADPLIVDADPLIVDAVPLIVDAVPGGGNFLPTTRVMGETTAERKLEEIWTSLLSDSVQKVGVYGMGGSGKTTIIKHIHNRVLKEKGKFDRAIWITMPKAMDIINIQSHIASALVIDIEMVRDDEFFRAALIYHELQQKKRWVLILDDMWEAFNLEDVGIPEPTIDNGCKLVLTTRSLKVCQLMSCECIKIELLSEDEAWNLFLDKVGPNVTMTPDLEAIAKQVSKECARLPLAIITIGRSMNGVVDDREWRNALNELRKSVEGLNDMGKVIQRLKFSYTNLGYEKLQRSLLYCALYPEDYQIKRDELIAYLIAEEIVKGTGSREQSFDEGHAILNSLENACLLESSTNFNGTKFVRMHDVIRDMALQIMGPGAVVEAGVGLRDFPDKQKWTENLETVSLMHNNMVKIYPDESPRCSRLKTLLLLGNKDLREIPDCFFLHIPSLQLLDISFTNIRIMPNSISDMENLTALRLNGCTVLRYVPSLAKLRGLRELDVSSSTIEELPEGLEMLVNLQYLNLYSCWRLKRFQTGILPKLRQLQYLNLFFGYNALEIKGEEVACLMKLETLVCQFHALNDLNTYVRSTMIQRSLPNSYVLQVGSHDPYMKIKFKLWGDGQHHKYVGVNKHLTRIQGTTEFIVQLPNDVVEFYCGKWDKVSCLSNVLVRQGQGVNASSSPQPPDTFRHIRNLDISKCPNMKKLFTPRLVPLLQILEKIYVSDCPEMKEIFAADGGEEEECMSEGSNNDHSISKNVQSYNYSTKVTNVDNAFITITLPKLRVFELEVLPQLKSIVGRRGIMVCNSIQEIKVMKCPKLKRLPLSLPVRNGRPSPPLSLTQIIIDEEAWWNSLEWDNAIAKDMLRRFLRIGHQSAPREDG